MLDELAVIVLEVVTDGTVDETDPVDPAEVLAELGGTDTVDSVELTTEDEDEDEGAPLPHAAPPENSRHVPARSEARLNVSDAAEVPLPLVTSSRAAWDIPPGMVYDAV